MNSVWAVFRKEWLDTRRDIKGILPMLFMPVIFALTNYGALSFIVSMQQEQPEFVLSVLNSEGAQPLIAELQNQGIAIKSFNGNPVAAVANGQVAMVLRIPEHFATRFREQRTANIELIWDLSRNDHHATASRIKSHVNTWLRTIGAQRLILRGISPEAAHVGQIIDVNTAKEQQMAMRILGSVPLFLVLVAFIAGAGVATEMAAGEREGRTLETLLLAPSAKYKLLLGKWLMACSLSMMVMVLALFGQFLAIHFAPTAELGLRVTLALTDYLLVLLVLTPLVVLANSLLLFISLQARSLKDAQTYTQLVTLLPTATGLYVLLANHKTSVAIASTPLLGNQALIADVLSGRTVPATHILFNTVGCIAVATLCATLAVKAFRLR